MSSPTKDKHQTAITKPTISAKISSTEIKDRMLRLSSSTQMSSSITTSHRQFIALQRLEEEKKLNEERDRRYLENKYRILTKKYSSDKTIEKSHMKRTLIQSTIQKSNEETRMHDKCAIKGLQRLQLKSGSGAKGLEKCDACSMICDQVYLDKCCVCDKICHKTCMDTIEIHGRNYLICSKCNVITSWMKTLESDEHFKQQSKSQLKPFSEFEIQSLNPSQHYTETIPIEQQSNQSPDQLNDIQVKEVLEPTPGERHVLTSSQIASRYVVTKDLPVFDGRPEEWPMFLSRFNNSTELCGYTNSENLDRLQKCLKNNALDAVKSRLHNAESVPDIIKTLKMLYGRPELIINSLMKKIRAEPPPEADNLNSLVDFALSVRNVCATVEQAQMHQHLSNPALIQALVDKLPTNMKIEWAKHKAGNLNISLSTLGNFLYTFAEVIVSITTPEEIYDSDNDNGSSNQFNDPAYGAQGDEWLYPNRTKQNLLIHTEDNNISRSSSYEDQFDVLPGISFPIELVDSKTGGTVVNVGVNTDLTDASIPTEDRSSEKE